MLDQILCIKFFNDFLGGFEVLLYWPDEQEMILPLKNGLAMTKILRGIAEKLKLLES